MRARRLLLTALSVAVLAAAATAPAAAPAPAPAAPAPAQLLQLWHDVQVWLTASGFEGFQVDRVVLFSRDAYAAVDDRSGNGAFELLLFPQASWLMPAPTTTMWNTTYGMPGGGLTLKPEHGVPGLAPGLGDLFRGWHATGPGKVPTLAAAVARANEWLAVHRPDETAGTDGRSFPGYFTLDTIRAGKDVGLVSVNASTGAVWYQTWHGRFLAQRSFVS